MKIKCFTPKRSREAAVRFNARKTKRNTAFAAWLKKYHPKKIDNGNK